MNSKLIRPLAKAHREMEQKARDAEWEDAPSAQALRDRADRMKERLDSGEEWEVMF